MTFSPSDIVLALYTKSVGGVEVLGKITILLIGHSVVVERHKTLFKESINPQDLVPEGQDVGDSDILKSKYV